MQFFMHYFNVSFFRQIETFLVMFTGIRAVIRKSSKLRQCPDMEVKKDNFKMLKNIVKLFVNVLNLLKIHIYLILVVFGAPVFPVW